jgi:hypothetical protein
MPVPDLKALYGSDYRVILDEAAESRTDPTMYEIPGKYGRVYPYGDELLAIEIDYHNKIATLVGKLPGVRCVQDGDFEKTLTFPPSLFDRVDQLTHLKRKRHRVLTDEQRAALVERCRGWHAKRGSVPGPLPGPTSPSADETSTGGDLGLPEALAPAQAAPGPGGGSDSDGVEVTAEVNPAGGAP